MDQLEIQVQPRAVIGKKVRFLRRQGVTPANVYGNGIDSYPIQADAKELAALIARAGTSRLVGLRLPADREPKRALVREVRRDPVSGQLLHVNFYEVKMTEKLKAEVHLAFAGDAPALKGGGGVLLHSLSSVEVECLPGELPESIQVDLSSLENVDDTIHVKDLPTPPGVTILTNPDELVAKVAVVRAEKEEVVEEAEEAAPAEAAPEAAKEEAGEETA